MEKKGFTAQEKMSLTRKLVDFLDEQMPAGHFDVDDRLEVMLLAYHASTNTDYLRRLLSSAS